MQNKNNILQRLARYLLLHASFTENIGLLNGKMGIALFFYHYSRYTGKQLYDDFAGELLDEIYKEINRETPLNFKDGLCGIAWGIEYLIRNKFVEAKPDEILEELDKRIMEWDVRKIMDYSLRTGLAGIACYVVSRRQNRLSNNPFLTKQYCSDLIKAMEKNGKKDWESSFLIETLNRIQENETIETLYNPVFRIAGKIRFDRETIFEPTRATGINNRGYAGIGLQLMKI